MSLLICVPAGAYHTVLDCSEWTILGESLEWEPFALRGMPSYGYL